MNIIEANVATPDARVAITIARFNNFIMVALPTLNMSLVVQATAWRMLPRTAKFRLLLGF